MGDLSREWSRPTTTCLPLLRKIPIFHRHVVRSLKFGHLVLVLWPWCFSRHDSWECFVKTNESWDNGWKTQEYRLRSLWWNVLDYSDLYISRGKYFHIFSLHNWRNYIDNWSSHWRNISAVKWHFSPGTGERPGNEEGWGRLSVLNRSEEREH